MIPVLIDSCTWIKGLAGTEPFLSIVRQLTADERYNLLAHEFVYGELLIGDKGARATFLANTYVKLDYARTVAHREVVELVRARKLYGIGIGWIDAHLLASAMAGGALLYTADNDLHKAAVLLDIAYHP